MVAGKDTISSGLTWFLWLVATHPSVEAKILEEMREHFLVNNKIKWDAKEISKLVYLHGAICESLRLSPPAPSFCMQLTLTFSQAATVLIQILECCIVHTQWEGWKAHGAKIA
jgi:cytochrome P450